MTATPANAPKSILPSKAMLMTPARSLSSPPSAAKINGTDSRMPWATQFMSMISITGSPRVR